MILDRVFGLIAAVAFALGIIAQAQLLSRPDQLDPFDPLLVTVAALALIAIGYITLRADRRHGLIDPYDESVDLVEVAFSLPRWAIGFSAVLASEFALALLAVQYPNLVALLPAEFAALRQGLAANGIIAVALSGLTLASFVVAAFFLVRAPIKEFH